MSGNPFQDLADRWSAALDKGCPFCGPVGAGCDHIEGYHYALSDLLVLLRAVETTEYGVQFCVDRDRNAPITERNDGYMSRGPEWTEETARAEVKKLNDARDSKSAPRTDTAAMFVRKRTFINSVTEWRPTT